MTGPIRDIVIVGGGTAGWMTAAALSRCLGQKHFRFTLVESKAIGTVGVGEATIPMIQLFNDILGLDEDEFVRETNATFKLGIRFVGWRREGEAYFHPFGSYGVDMDGIGFAHYWQRLARSGGSADYGRFNLETLCARQGRFGRVVKAPGIPDAKVNYAFQFDANLYANFLRRYAEAKGVRREEGRIVKVRQASANGYVEAVELDDGRVVKGDLYIDCSGFRGLLINETLGNGFVDWAKWLPCNRAVTVQSARPATATTPFTTSTARPAGWQWRIPLQSRTGNGYVFCDQFQTLEEATEILFANLDAEPTTEPRALGFTAGHREKFWDRNVIAIGLAAGFLEPLESTSIHFVQAAIAKLLSVFPQAGIISSVVDLFNRELIVDYCNVRDFLIAHYKITERSDTPFWNYCRTMQVPESLAARLEIFKASGQAAVGPYELFKEASWFSVLIGQGLYPAAYHPIADIPTRDELINRLAKISSSVERQNSSLPSHDDFILSHCAAGIDRMTKKASVSS